MTNAVFDRPSEHGVKLKASDCEFGKRRFTFLMYIVSSPEIASLSNKVTAILDYEEPHSYPQLGYFVGLVNFIDATTLIERKCLPASQACCEGPNLDLRFMKPRNGRLPPSARLFIRSELCFNSIPTAIEDIWRLKPAKSRYNTFVGVFRCPLVCPAL